MSPLQPGVAYLYPLKTGFLMFSGDIDTQNRGRLNGELR